MTDGSERSQMWNLFWLCGGLTFSAWVFAQVPNMPQVQELKRQAQNRNQADGRRTSSVAVPRLPDIYQIKPSALGPIVVKCLESCLVFFRDDLRIAKADLRDAILRVPVLNVAGTGLEEAVDQALGLDQGWARSDDPLARNEFELAMAAAIVSAQQLARGRLLSLQLDGVTSPTGDGATWSALHSIIILGLVARELGCDENEFLREAVQPLQLDNSVDYGFADRVEQALAGLRDSSSSGWQAEETTEIRV